MKKFKNILNINTAKIVIAAIIVLLGSFALTRAGSLTPSGTPAPTFYTLNDIYTRLITNATSTAGNHSLSITTSPATSMHTLTEIYNAIPTIDPTKVLTGTTYLGVAGTLNSGNANVPNDAPILPAQAFVDNIMQANGSFANASGFQLSNKGFTHFDQRFLYNYNADSGFNAGFFPFAGNNGWTFDVDLSGNALPVEDINAILATSVIAQNDFGFNPGVVTLDLSGGTNAAPTGIAHVDGQYTLDVSALGQLDFIFGPNSFENSIQLDGGHDLADSYIAGGCCDASMNIGINDNPTIDQITAKILELFPSDPALGTATSTGHIISATVSNDTYLPIINNGSQGTIFNSGTAAGQNADKQTLEDNGWTVLTN